MSNMIRIEPSPHGPVLHFEGELTIFQAGEYLTQLRALEAGEESLVADLSATTEVDGAGIQLLIALRKQLETTGSRLTLQSPSPAVTEALATCDLHEHFHMESASAPC
ncbi:STAS domain-containing protein [Thiorhodococcus fuscus]|uniref:STAS domain-containing protein n=1 Tax=Thiorhodococcus fuscus TaxID=527200 RepID=A0ABW4YAW2_9GAMM